MIDFIRKNIQYPEAAKKEGIQGRVVVMCVIRKDGTIDKDNIKVSTSCGAELDNEAIRVIKSMPKWIPGKQNGKIVNVRYNIPVRFMTGDKIDESQKDTRTPKEKKQTEYLIHNYYERALSGYWKYGVPKDTVKHILKLSSELRKKHTHNLLYYKIETQCYNALGEYEKAMSVINDMEKVFPNDHSVPLFRGYYYDMLGQKEKADEQYRKALIYIDNDKETPQILVIQSKIFIIDLLEGLDGISRFIKQTLENDNLSNDDKNGIESYVQRYIIKYRQERKDIVWKSACGAPVNLSGQDSEEERIKAANFYH